MNKPEKLIQLVQELAVTLASPDKPFILKSGELSNYYLDCRMLTLEARGLYEVVRWFDTLLRPYKFNAIGGPSLGADPIIGGLLHLYGVVGLDNHMKGFLVRKEEKGYGIGGRVVGPIMPGDRCVVIEDVANTGSSAWEAVECVRANGAKVELVACIVDRLNGASEFFASKNIPFRSLLTIADLKLTP